jgi:flavin reductase (DIM6/NTAB) family NADH-FMN oxidoreductase RutF
MPVFKNDLATGLKAGMRRLAASVCVISLLDKQGVRHAMTATAVTSLSDNPPALLVCVNKNAAAYQALADGMPFCVNVLNEQQMDISVHCASKSEDGRFSKGSWHTHNGGLPYLGDAEVSFFCVNEKVVEYGSHLVAIGKLEEVLTRDGEPSPLLYADGKYHSLS